MQLGVDERDFIEACLLSSISDETCRRVNQL